MTGDFLNSKDTKEVALVLAAAFIHATLSSSKVSGLSQQQLAQSALAQAMTLIEETRKLKL
jgi:hypothetical protein